MRVKIAVSPGANAEEQLFQWFLTEGDVLLNPNETPYAAGALQEVEWDFPLNTQGYLAMTCLNGNGQSVVYKEFNTGAPENPPPPPPPNGEPPGPGSFGDVTIVYVND